MALLYFFSPQRFYVSDICLHWFDCRNTRSVFIGRFLLWMIWCWSSRVNDAPRRLCLVTLPKVNNKKKTKTNSFKLLFNIFYRFFSINTKLYVLNPGWIEVLSFVFVFEKRRCRLYCSSKEACLGGGWVMCVWGRGRSIHTRSIFSKQRIRISPSSCLCVFVRAHL